MIDYKAIEMACKKSLAVSEALLDDFLIPYCGKKEGIDAPLAKKLGHYRDIIKIMPEGWPSWIAAQYIAHRLFRKDGHARAYRASPVVQARSPGERAYLDQQIENPWKFAFCSVLDSPAPRFFNMRDVLADEEFLLYSPGVLEIQEQHGRMQMLFALIGFNGHCWQTFGPIVYLRGMQPFDLLYFAKLLDPRIVFMNEIPELIDEDPVPFMMLWSGGEIPCTFHQQDLIVLNNSEFHEEAFDPSRFSDDFSITKKYPVYRLSLKELHEHPHFADSYYHAKKHRLILTAMTDRGYAKLIETFNKAGYELPATPDIRATMAMHVTAKKVLKTELELNPYEKTFAEPASPEKEREVAKINVFLMGLLDAHNAG